MISFGGMTFISFPSSVKVKLLSFAYVSSLMIFTIFTFGIWQKSVIEVLFSVLVNWGVSGLDRDFWVEGSKSVKEESNKLSF